MAQVKATEIEGDVAVGRHVAMGGDAKVEGGAVIKGNLVVEGWMNAKNLNVQDATVTGSVINVNLLCGESRYTLGAALQALADAGLQRNTDYRQPGTVIVFKTITDNADGLPIWAAYQLVEADPEGEGLGQWLPFAGGEGNGGMVDLNPLLVQIKTVGDEAKFHWEELYGLHGDNSTRLDGHDKLLQALQTADATELAARQQAIADEAEARQLGDAQVQAAVEAEAEARQEADSLLQGKLDTEQANREAAVTAEQTARQLGDQANASLVSGLQADVDAHIRECKQEQEGLVRLINSETQQRKDKDDEFMTVINNLNAGLTYARNLVPNSYLGICTNKNIDRIRKVWLTAGRTYTWSANAHIGKDAREELEIGIYNDIEPGNAEHFESYMYFANQGHDKTESFQIYPTYTGWYYIDINYYAEFTVEYAVVNWIQIEEGVIATPWTPNKDDAQVNANLWPLEKDCVLTALTDENEPTYTMPNGTTAKVYYADCPTGGYDQKDVIRCNDHFNTTEADGYTLSFYAKGENSNIYVAFFDMLIGCCFNNGFGEQEWAGEPQGQAGSAQISLTSEWKRYEIHMTAAANVTNSSIVFVHLPQRVDGQRQGRMWLAGIKLEHGGRATEYGIGERDFLATGFNIRENRFQVNANNFEVQNLQGQRTMGIDADGNVMVSKLAVEQANPDWKSGIFAYIDETGNPCLRGVDAYGNIRWRFTGEIHTDTTDDVGMTITPKSSCYANFNDMGDIRTYTATYDIYVMVQNKSNAAVTYTANSIACRARLGNGQYESEYVNVTLRNSITVPAGDMAEAHFFARSVKLTYDKTTDRPVGYEAFYSGQGLTAMALYLAHGMEIKNMYDIMVYDGSAMPTNLIE